MYNQELSSAQANPHSGATGANDAADLNDFATVGWFTLDRNGVITATNPAGARLLSRSADAAPGPRVVITGQQFAGFLADTDQTAFDSLLAAFFAGRSGFSCEACVASRERPVHPFRTLRIEAALAADRQTCNLVVIDISAPDAQNVIAFDPASSQTHSRTPSETQLHTIEEAVDAFFQGDADGNMVRVNQLGCTLTGYSRQELLSMRMSELFSTDELARTPLRYDLLRAGELVTSERLLTRKDGGRVAVEMKSRRMSDGTYQSFFRDLTRLKQAEARLQLAASVFDHAREGIIVADIDGSIVEVNDTFTQITGYSREDVIGQNPRMLGSGQHAPEFYAELWHALTTRGHWSGEVINRRKNGDLYPQLLTINVVRDAAGQAANYVALFSDITAIREHEKQIEHVTHHDVLTNLPNRTLLTDRLHQAIGYSQRRKRSLAIVYVDLDGFKLVNDRFGREAGDELLTIIAQRMKDELREGDTLARIGSDEFIAVLNDLDSTHDCEPVIARLLEVTAAPATIRNLELRVSSSIGVTLFPHDGADADQLIRHADQAMSVAKQAGKNRYHLFDVDQDAAVKTLRATLDEIVRALEQQEFVLHFQPKVNMKTGRVIGAEALIRWQHRERGLLLPSAFLPTVQDHPISVAIGDWVIKSALDQMVEWDRQRFRLPISVNVGARQLQHGGFVRGLNELLRARPRGLSKRLEIEILESSALEDIAQISETMRACRRIGINFAIDDFGTGYSSLTYLRRLPAEQLKIDQSFVRDMLVDPEDLAIVEGVIGLAAAFRRQVIAEGVESIAHGELLLKLGCELAQGYGIARPMPGDQLPGWVSAWRPDASWAGKNGNNGAESGPASGRKSQAELF